MSKKLILSRPGAIRLSKGPIGALDVHVTRADTGADVAGAQVHLRGPRRYSEATPASGTAAFPTIKAGTYRVMVELPAPMADQYRRVPSQTVVVERGGQPTVEVALEPLGALQVHVMRSDTGAALPGAVVKLRGPETHRQSSAPRSGVATFDRIVPGTYELAVEFVGDKVQAFTAPEVREVEVPPVDPKIEAVEVDPTGTVQIKVVRSDTQAPAGALRVALHTPTLRSAAANDQTGIATFEHVPAGTYEAEVVLDAGNAYDFEPPDPARISITLQPGKTADATIALTPIVELKVTESDSHFAPGAEDLEVTYEIGGLSGEDVTLEVTSDHYPDGPLYTRPLRDDETESGTHRLRWNGFATGAGPLKDRFINPLYAPYKLTLKTDAGPSADATFSVLYHSLSLNLGTYTVDGKAPDKDAEPVKWVQYRLNELGYLAGPVDGIDGPQTKRAVRRYTYAQPGFYGDEKEIEDLANDVFLEQLERGDGARAVLEGGDLPDLGGSARLVLDHDYFYHEFSGADFSNPQGHVTKDAAKLDRVELPLEVEVLLVGKDDADGSGQGVASPGAVGPVDVQWIAHDPAAHTAGLPAPSAAVPSRGKPYVEAALQALGQDAANPADANDNAPDTLGGVRAAANPNAAHFRTGDKLPPFTCTAAGDDVYTPAHANPDEAPEKLGRAGVLFRGSTVAGDNYVLEARIAFDRLGHGDAVGQLHEAFRGEPIAEALSAKTGELVIWRRHHVAAVVNWPDTGRGIALAEVAQQYALAHCELETDHNAYTAAKLFKSKADKDAYLDLVNTHFPAEDRKKMRFDKKALWPLKPPKQAAGEDDATYEQNIRNYYRPYADDPDFQDALAELLFEKVRATHEPGAILLRPNWTPPIKVKQRVRVRKPVIGEVTVTRTRTIKPCYSCIGLPFGVSFMDNEMTAEEQDGFLYAHEMAHTRYLQHHETDRSVHDPTDANFGITTYDFPDQHDQNDHNCTMCYPDGIASRPGLTWNHGDAEESRFCGKCLLKLQGWNVTDAALPASS